MTQKRKTFVVFLLCLTVAATVWLSTSTSSSARSVSVSYHPIPANLTDLVTIHVEGGLTTSTAQPPSIDGVVEGVERCMRMANFDLKPLLTQAKENARYFYKEFRKAIPEKGLSGYRSHCWRRGLNSRMHFGIHSSKILCLPNVFVIGFAKCGTTYLHSFLQRLISMSTGDWERRQYAKEIDFWVRFKPFRRYNKYKPRVEQLGRYLRNFIPGIKKISNFNQKDVMLVDSTANTVRDWPRFTKTENDFTNYCLIPATLPRLFPDSKYITIMRNPTEMTYSIFWFSCTDIGVYKIPRGPDIFHKRMMTKISSFNDCMRDASLPNINYACTVRDKANYSSCIKQRLHLLDKCHEHVLMDIYSPELPRCGTSWLSVAIYYINVRKWLKLVPREHLLFLTLEELKLHPSEAAGEILQFLDYTSIASSTKSMEKILQIDGKKKNQANYKKNPSLHMREDTRHALEVFYHPFNTLLAELLNSDKFLWF